MKILKLTQDELVVYTEKSEKKITKVSDIGIVFNSKINSFNTIHELYHFNKEVEKTIQENPNQYRPEVPYIFARLEIKNN